jgi:CRISPR-associated protein Csb2
MPQYLCLSATLLTSRYHAEEWPPSPARAFQALVAGVMTGGYRRHWGAAQSALAWLERLPPPEIAACPERAGESYRLAVPNNDFDVVAREWAKGKSADPSAIRTMKAVAPKFLPASGPHVHYLWNLDDQPEKEIRKHSESLAAAAHCLHTLGWGVDMAFAGVSVVENPEWPTLRRWRVSPSGALRTVPVPGFLADLRDCYERFQRRTKGAGVDPNTHPTVVGYEYYQRVGEVRRPFVAFRMVRTDSGEGEQPYSRAAHESMKVAAWMRHATAEALRTLLNDEKRLNEFVLGHVDSGERSHRLSFLPLPSVGHRHVDGRIRRIAVVEPLGADGSIVARTSQVLPGAALVAEGSSRPLCRLAPVDEKDKVVQQYTGHARAWRTVTPMILHGFSAQRGQISPAKTEKLLREAFAEAGYPPESIQSLAIQPAPMVAGAVGARDILVPAHLAKWPRYHVRVEFASPVPGPVLAGIGRHYGIGLFVRED